MLVKGAPGLQNLLTPDILVPIYGSAEGPPRGVENRNVLSHPDDLKLEAYLIRMT